MTTLPPEILSTFDLIPELYRVSANINLRLFLFQSYHNKAFTVRTDSLVTLVHPFDHARCLSFIYSQFAIGSDRLILTIIIASIN